MMNKIERLEDRIRRNKSEIRNLKNILSNTEDEYEAENWRQIFFHASSL